MSLDLCSSYTHPALLGRLGAVLGFSTETTRVFGDSATVAFDE